MNRIDYINRIVKEVKKKHPWYISQDKYSEYVGELPRDFLEERIHYDNLTKKSQTFNRCKLVLDQVKVEIRLTIDELIEWEIMLARQRHDINNEHDVRINDIKKALNDCT